jgi:hypothetical protein
MDVVLRRSRPPGMAARINSRGFAVNSVHDSKTPKMKIRMEADFHPRKG